MSFEDKLYPFINLYYKLPKSISFVIGSIYSSVPKNIRLGRKYQYFYNLAHNNSDLVCQDYINRQFLSVIDSASHIPFYKKLYSDHGVKFSDIKTVEDVVKLPTISKEDVKSNLSQMVNPMYKDKRLYLTTGGSTGVPVGFYLHNGISRVKETAYFDFLWSTKGYIDRPRIAIIRGLNFRSSDGFSRYDPIKNALLLSSYYITHDRFSCYISKLNEFEPLFIQAYPSSIYLLARMIKYSGVSLNFTPKYIFCGSENLYKEQVELIESVFKCKVFSWYGHTERALLAKRLDSGGYSFIQSYGLAELIDLEGGPVVEGNGELCGTSFHNLVMPLIRYRTHDLAIIEKNVLRKNIFEPLVVSSIEGRLQEFVYSYSRRPVSMTALNMHDDVFVNLERFQFSQSRLGFVDFIYTGKFLLSNKDEKRIHNSILTKLGEGFVLTIKNVDDISLTKSGKQSFLVQKLHF